ncbi:MAG: hypothetical protein JWL73_3609 [Actinomycetia bacterium]|nr:hypothetical protein [Actinomycetes bacterium]
MRRDIRRLWVTGALAVIAGIAVAGAMLWATSRNKTPTKPQPFAAGVSHSIRAQLNEGPFYYPDPFGGVRDFWFAIENGNIAALSANLPGEKGCRVRYKGDKKGFVDCHNARVPERDLARFQLKLEVGKHKYPYPLPASGPRPSAKNAREGVLLVYLNKLLPPPGATTTTAAG